MGQAFKSCSAQVAVPMVLNHAVRFGVATDLLPLDWVPLPRSVPSGKIDYGPQFGGSKWIQEQWQTVNPSHNGKQQRVWPPCWKIKFRVYWADAAGWWDCRMSAKATPQIEYFHEGEGNLQVTSRDSVGRWDGVWIAFWVDIIPWYELALLSFYTC